MIGIYKNFRLDQIRLYITCSLIFFFAFLSNACRSPETPSNIIIRWQDKRAVGLTISGATLQSVPADSLNQLVMVRLINNEISLLGSYQSTKNGIIFEPLVPFTRGLSYTVWLRNKRLGEVTIPSLGAGDKPTLLAIYPSQDSLPANLLKIYLHFSRPMREGQSLTYISLVKNNVDTLPGVFLNLQPELWNADRTLLTLWLDPGRIKRDLQPNKRLGAPLQARGNYQLVVSADWPDEQGALLGKKTVKPFLVTHRDSLSPMPAYWTLRRPEASSSQPLKVNFGESLDYALLTETMHVVDKANKPVQGQWQLSNEEKGATFTPGSVWRAGQYRLKIEGRLEDLSGNNLNRPFDRDLTGKKLSATFRPFTELVFEVR